MIIGIEGGLGSGKTLIMVRYLKKDFDKGKKILCNFGLTDIKHTPVDVIEVLENQDLQDCSIGIDEMTVFLDCRSGMSKQSKLISYFILQTRKRNVTLYFTTQDFDMIDKRLIQHTDIMILAQKIFKNGVEVDGWRRYAIFDYRNSRMKPDVSRFHLNISKYYGYYDTNEIILPPV